MIEALVRAEVEFVVVGGLAVVTWGHERFTRDIDLVPNPDSENLDRLAETLERLGGKVIVGDRRLTGEAIRIFLKSGDMALVKTDLGHVDVIQGVPHVPSYAEMVAEAEVVELDVGLVVRVCSGRHLLGMKRAANRPRDIDDIEALLEAHPEWRETDAGS